MSAGVRAENRRLHAAGCKLLERVGGESETFNPQLETTARLASVGAGARREDHLAAAEDRQPDIPQTRPGFAKRSLLAAVCLVGLAFSTAASPAISSDALFHLGSGAYHAGDYVRAAQAFEQAGTLEPASGTLQNLGNAEWKRGRSGPAVLSWERALWVDPFNHAAQTNLRFARKTAQLESPELTWYEVVSTWLPVNWWAWIASGSFWLALALVLLPGILRWRKLTWYQAVAALGFAVFLLSVPAHWGVNTRSRIGFVLEKEAPLRLTPTSDAQVITRLPSGEPARLERLHGVYALVHTSRASGWIMRDQLGLISQPLLPSKPPG